MQKNKVLVFAPFFRKIPIRQNRLSQILMKPLLSILIFQRELDFPAPGAIRDFLGGFSGTYVFGTFSTQTRLRKKVSS